jgi:NADH:ubiquinone reductase (H+-translocating)
MKKAHVVIVGGGFGGVYTGRHLESLVNEGKVDVTIINKTNYFLFTPLLHEVATGGLSAMSVVEPIREIFRHECIHFIQDSVTFINPAQKQVTTTNRTIGYDYLVISSGAETNYYGTLGAQDNTLSLKNLNDALVIRKRIIDLCEQAAHIADDETRKRMLSVVVVGGGATGVELSAEIIEFMQETLCTYYGNTCHLKKDDMQVTVVAASPDLLPPFPPALREIAKKELIRKGVKVMTSETVTEVKQNRIIFADKSFIDAGTIIWVAGVKPMSPDIPGIEKEKNGRIKIDEFLRVAGTTDIFCLGDTGGTAPMLAQVASQQGKTVADNIAAAINNTSPVPFKFFEKGLLVSLGQWYAAGKIMGLTLKGPFMWILWRGIYLFNFHSWRKRFKIIIEWIVNLFYPRDITEV